MGWVESSGRQAKPHRGVAWNTQLQKKDSSRTFASDVEADAWWRGREFEIQQIYAREGVNPRRPQRREAPTFAEYGRQVIQGLSLEKSTKKTNLGHFNTEIRMFFGEHIKVHEVTRKHIREMLGRAMARGCGPSGRMAKLVAVRKVLRAAVDEDLRPDDPTVGIDAPQLTGKRSRILTLDEIDALHKAMPDHLAISVLLMAHAGLRIGEACGLQTHNVSTDSGVIIVQHVLDERGFLRDYPKGKEPEPVPMTPQLQREMKAHLGMYDEAGNNGFVLFNRRRQIAIRPPSLREWMYKAIDAAEITAPRPTPHDLRHTTATLLAHKGTQAYDIQRVLRHKNLSTSQRYIDAMPEAGRAALERAFTR